MMPLMDLVLRNLLPQASFCIANYLLCGIQWPRRGRTVRMFKSKVGWTEGNVAIGSVCLQTRLRCGVNRLLIGYSCAGLKLAHGEVLSTEEEAILKEAEAEYENAQKTKGDYQLVFLVFQYSI